MSLFDKASLIVTPNGRKESKVYAVVPTNGNGDLTFTRATTATRVDSTGVIDVVPYNLLSNSQVFNIAYWSKNLTTAVDNNTTSPNGNTNASKLTEVAGTGSHHIHEATGSFTAVVGSSYTMSCFVKLPTTAFNRFVQLPFFLAGFGANAYVNFDLQNGVVGTIGSSITSSNITALDNGWFRISASALATAAGSSGFQLSFITTATSARTESYTVTAEAEKAIFLFGAQIQNDGLKDYFATTNRLNVPRFNYDTVGGCPSLLLEPQRTNLVFPSAILTTQTRTVTAVSHTLSFYGTGTIVLSGAFIGTLTGTGANNRVTLTFTPSAGSLILTVTGTITNAQLEIGAYSTSYIPTTTGSVTRNADTFSRNNIYTNNLITSAGGTWFVELNNNLSLIRDAGGDLGIGNNNPLTLGSSFTIRSTGSTTNRLQIFKYISGVFSISYQTLTNTAKIAIKWNGVTADFFVNGVKVVNATAFTTTNMEFLLGNASDVPKYIKSMMLFPTPLTDTECINLTTL